MYYKKGQEPILTENQRKLATTYAPHLTDTLGRDKKGKPIPRLVPMLSEGLMFQPQQAKYNFKHGIAKDADGRDMYNGKKPIMENSLIASHKEQVIMALKAEHGDNWKHVFQHPKTLLKLS